MDMAGFAIHVKKILSKPDVKMGFMTIKGHRRPVKDGHLETSYLEHFASQSTVECRGAENEVSFTKIFQHTNFPGMMQKLRIGHSCSFSLHFNICEYSS